MAKFEASGAYKAGAYKKKRVGREAKTEISHSSSYYFILLPVGILGKGR